MCVVDGSIVAIYGGSLSITITNDFGTVFIIIIPKIYILQNLLPTTHSPQMPH